VSHARLPAFALALALLAAGCQSARAPDADTAALERQYLRDASRAFLSRDFRTAADLYARALELEKQRPILSRDQ
jgi:hypothetical protein